MINYYVCFFASSGKCLPTENTTLKLLEITMNQPKNIITENILLEKGIEVEINTMLLNEREH